MQPAPNSPLFSRARKMKRMRELKKIIDHRKRRDKDWEDALEEYVDLILEFARS